ncbi:GNAT family N-acetyltransferase [uncultured Ilyobacter sp.]|uniref:GNAT family N-acetyltransferase n=1 Tax=uncultured Ilyobacter sp. TaxID=544433 RepID=UPI0029BFFF0C|nr:GNAT family N-acetyltransferase [uncultured Ilyobacter sp.]
MEVLHNENKKMFYIEKDGLIIAELTYVYGGEGKIAINHTYVEPEYRGDGLAQKLAVESIKYARENNFKIIPVCSFAVTFFRKHEEYADVLL